MTLVLIDDEMPEYVSAIREKTPFGTVSYGRQSTVIWVARRDADPRAAAYAARALGGDRVLSVARDTGVDQLVYPQDFIEFTTGRPTTYFVTIGTGFVQQNPPFCPEMTSHLLQAGVLMGGTLVILDQLPDVTVAAWWRTRPLEPPVTHFSTGPQPEGALCRELELCWGVLLAPAGWQATSWAPAYAASLGAERACACGTTMAYARSTGRLPANWREWFTVEEVADD